MIWVHFEHLMTRSFGPPFEGIWSSLWSPFCRYFESFFDVILRSCDYDVWPKSSINRSLFNDFEGFGRLLRWTSFWSFSAHLEQLVKHILSSFWEHFWHDLEVILINFLTSSGLFRNTSIYHHQFMIRTSKSGSGPLINAPGPLITHLGGPGAAN